MYLEIYPDIVFILNFCFDIILLLLVKLVNRKKSSLLRLCLAATIGGCSAVMISLIPWVNSMTNLLPSLYIIKALGFLLKLITIPLILLVAFGRMKWTDLLKQGICFCFITYFVGGLMNSIYYNTELRLKLLILGDGIMFSNLPAGFVALAMLAAVLMAIGLLFIWRLYRRKEKDIYNIELTMEGRCIQSKGLFDTGNCLYDPLYHKPVIVLERCVMEKLLSKDFLDEFENMKNYLSGVGQEEAMTVLMEQSGTAKNMLRRLRIIPYSSIGKEQGMMFGLMLDQLVIHTGKETVYCQKITAAISENHLSPGEEYHVILHKELLYT